MRFWPLLGAFVVACSSSPATEPSSSNNGDAGGVPRDDGGATSAATAACDSLTTLLQPKVDAILKTAKTTDVGVGVITDACPFVAITSGPSSLEADARFRFASITKTYTSAVILNFVATGAVGLDDTIAKFSLALPNATSITVRELLNHSSGLFDYTNDPGFPTHLDWTPAERLQIAASHATTFAPGTGFHYSNTNFIALGMIAEQLGGGPKISALIRATVTGPRKLDSTYFDGEDAPTGMLAPSFAVGGKAISESEGRSGAWADGAIVATLSDETHWMRAYASGDATPTLKTDLLAGISEGPGVPETYGLALQILSAQATGDVPAYGHAGDIPGFHSLSLYFPAHGWTVTTVVNRDGGDPNIVMQVITDTLTASGL